MWIVSQAVHIAPSATRQLIGVARASYSIANLSTSIQSRLSSRFDRLLPLLCAISAKPVSTIVRVVVTLIRAFGHRTTLLNTLKWPPFVFWKKMIIRA